MSLRRYAKLRTALEKLRETLDSQRQYSYRATFREVEKWSCVPLPPSAYTQRKWWSNNSHNNTNSNRPWERAGFRTEEVDMGAQTVVFRMLPRKVPTPSTAEEREAFKKRMEKFMSSHGKHDAPPQQVGMSDVAQYYTPQQGISHHPLRGALKGNLRIVAGTDLTNPADPDWADRS